MRSQCLIMILSVFTFSCESTETETTEEVAVVEPSDEKPVDQKEEPQKEPIPESPKQEEPEVFTLQAFLEKLSATLKSGTVEEALALSSPGTSAADSSCWNWASL